MPYAAATACARALCKQQEGLLFISSDQVGPRHVWLYASLQALVPSPNSTNRQITRTRPYQISEARSDRPKGQCNTHGIGAGGRTEGLGKCLGIALRTTQGDFQISSVSRSGGQVGTRRMQRQHSTHSGSSLGHSLRRAATSCVGHCLGHGRGLGQLAPCMERGGEVGP